MQTDFSFIMFYGFSHLLLDECECSRHMPMPTHAQLHTGVSVDVDLIQLIRRINSSHELQKRMMQDFRPMNVGRFWSEEFPGWVRWLYRTKICRKQNQNVWLLVYRLLACIENQISLAIGSSTFLPPLLARTINKKTNSQRVSIEFPLELRFDRH